MKNFRNLLLLLLAAPAFWACEPYLDKDIELGPLPGPPAFSVEILAEDSNRVVVRTLSEGFFSQLYSFPGGIPDRSTRAVDTVLYRKAGEYTITLYAAQAGGAGTSSTSRTVTIANDATVACTDEIVLLMGGCEDTDSKCWTFSRVAGAVTVGPFPGSGEWFRSTADGLQDQQYDDSFCFAFNNSRFQYLNNGLTVDPWNGYTPVPYTPPTDHTWIFGTRRRRGRRNAHHPDGEFLHGRVGRQQYLRHRIADRNGVGRPDAVSGGWRLV
jgi:hypothetical protein